MSLEPGICADYATFQVRVLGGMLHSKAGKTLKMGSLQRRSNPLKIPLDTQIKSANNQAGTFFNSPAGEMKKAEGELVRGGRLHFQVV
ncbi:MAG TPA: hypothetical protein VJR91_07000 [Burkholderia sp.]|nr:hypothetical protein [Burkholderia sp.]